MPIPRFQPRKDLNRDISKFPKTQSRWIVSWTKNSDRSSCDENPDSQNSSIRNKRRNIIPWKNSKKLKSRQQSISPAQIQLLFIIQTHISRIQTVKTKPPDAILDHASAQNFYQWSQMWSKSVDYAIVCF